MHVVTSYLFGRGSIHFVALISTLLLGAGNRTFGGCRFHLLNTYLENVTFVDTSISPNMVCAVAFVFSSHIKT